MSPVLSTPPQHGGGAGHGFRTTGNGQQGASTVAGWITGAGQHGFCTTGAGQPQPLCWFLSLACNVETPNPDRVIASTTASQVANLDEKYILPPQLCTETFL